MALQLNLLHEEITQERQRKRDPLKLGVIALSAIGAIMLLFYMVKVYQTLAIKSRLGAVERDWAQLEPKATAAQKRAAELNGIISTSNLLDTMIDNRFLWAPLLQKLSGCVAPNAQLNSLAGSVNPNKLVTLTIGGIAAGQEPRAAAEELRQLLSEQLGASYRDVTAEFKSLEDLETTINLAGVSTPLARYSILVTLKSPEQEVPKSTTSAQIRTKK